MLDHIVLATSDLAATTDWLASETGVTASPGGPHVGRGTCNNLAALGDSAYLEIIGPDPDQPEPTMPRPFGIDGIVEPGIVTWCARRGDIPGIMASAAGMGLIYEGPVAMQRDSPGGLLEWSLALPQFENPGGLIPFFINWGATPHPSQSAAPGLELTTFGGSHPDPGEIDFVLQRLGEPLEVRRGAAPGLRVRLSGPGGSVAVPMARFA